MPPTTLKFLLVGNGSAGKTSLCQRFRTDGFERVYRQTVGVDFYEKEVRVRDAAGAPLERISTPLNAEGAPTAVYRARMLPASMWVAGCCEDNTLRLWCTETLPAPADQLALPGTPWAVVGLGNGGAIVNYFAAAYSASHPNLRSITLVNGFAHVDSHFAGVMHVSGLGARALEALRPFPLPSLPPLAHTHRERGELRHVPELALQRRGGGREGLNLALREDDLLAHQLQLLRGCVHLQVLRRIGERGGGKGWIRDRMTTTKSDDGERERGEFRGGECCLLVLESVAFTPQWIRQPKPRDVHDECVCLYLNVARKS
jgi:hypothetical protein